jgi:hypothetical protein
MTHVHAHLLHQDPPHSMQHACMHALVANPFDLGYIQQREKNMKLGSYTNHDCSFMKIMPSNGLTSTSH